MSSQSPALPTLRLEILLVSFSAIVLEIALTRIFSYKLYDYFTYLILGTAMLGLGSGGVLVALVPALRRAGAERVVALGALAAGLAIPGTLAAVAFVQLNTVDLASHPTEALKLAALCLALFAPFLGVGVCVAKILGARAAQVHALYFADLLGAGLGCAACVPLFVTITPPGAIALAGLLLALVGLRLGSGAARPAALVAVPLAVGLAALVAFPGRIPDPVPDRIKAMSPQKKGDAPVLFSRWSALFRIDVLEGPAPDRYLILAHDGMLGSIVRHYEGDPAALADFDSDVRSLPFAVLSPGPEALIIGAAGGTRSWRRSTSGRAGSPPSRSPRSPSRCCAASWRSTRAASRRIRASSS